jgi:hypothetical protein
MADLPNSIAVATTKIETVIKEDHQLKSRHANILKMRIKRCWTMLAESRSKP